MFTFKELTLGTGIKNILFTLNGLRVVKKDSLFDKEFYLKKYEDVSRSGQHPLLHYIYRGNKEGRDPNPYFNGKYYLKKYPDVKKSGKNPFLHYLRHGKKEGRYPNIKKEKLSSKYKLKIAEKKITKLETSLNDYNKKITKLETSLNDYNEKTKMFENRTLAAENKITKLERSIQKYERLLTLNQINKDKIGSDFENFKGYGINKIKRSPKIIVSLTSFPERMYDVHFAIYSLLIQKLKPDEVILWLSTEEFPNKEDDIPIKVLNLKKHGLNIRFVDGNLKSYKKLIYALKEFPQDIIVTADDDVFYPEDWLEKLMDEYDGKNIVCHRAHLMIFDNGTVKPYIQWPKVIKTDEISFKNFFTGVGGVLYPPNCLYKDVLNENIFMELSPDADDVWFWAMGVMNKTKIKIVKNGYKMPNYVNPKRELGFSDEKILFATNSEKNTEFMKRVMDKYPEIMKKLKKETCVKVSIIVPVYNAEKHLQKCLDSLINQTLKDIEIICVNDGSTDSSLEILEKYASKDKRITIVNQKNQDRGTARNNGLKISKGEYVGFVDNDDWISKDYFEVLYTNAKKTNADISATSNVIFPEQNRKKDVGITSNGIIKSIKDKSKIIITSGVIWNKIYKREMVTKNSISFSPRRCIGEDNNFNIFTIILSNFIVTTNKVNYFWSQHHNSRNHAKRTEQDLLLLDNYRDILNKLSDLEIPSQQKEEWNTTINERMRLDFGNLLRDSDEDLKKKVLQKIEKYQDYNIKPDIQISQDKYSTKAMQINSFNIQKSLPQLENKFKVSIIMPTYNRAFIIKRAINSILNQTFSNYELIICDDGSTDNTEELLKRDYARYFKSGKFIYLKLEHYGVSKARNMGLKRSNGDLVAYLDSDNLWKPEFLEKMVGLFDSNPKFKSAYCALQAYNQVKNEHYILNSPYNRNKIVMGNYIDLNVFVHRRELYELFGGFNESLERLVDWDLILRYTEKDEPLFLDEILAQYYIHKKFDNISLKSNFEEQRKKVYDIHSNEIINTASSNTNFITDPRVTLLYLESENPINFPNYLKVGVFIDGELKSLGSCPYIRLYSPLEHLSVKKNFKIFIYGRDDISEVDMHKIMKCKLFDAIIIQRGAVDLETAKIILKKCKENKIKVIYESDDDLLSIEESNRNYPHLKKRIEAMDYLIKNSDLLTVSTDVLSERFDNANETSVVRNYLVKELQPIKNIKTQNDTKSIDIGYYGTLTHDDDLLMIEEPVRNIITKFKEKYDINVNLYIIGGMNKKHEESWFSKIEIPENATAFVSFMEWLRNNAKFDIMIAPLKDTIFNNAKSELKYIEYTALGIPGIYSDLPPYNSVVEDGLNGLLAKNNKDWEVKLEKLILDHNLRIKIVENAQKHIKESYLLEHRAEQWETIIQNITEKGRRK
jgi:glycosyltransferase involved in cell wall biosynthesis